MVATRYAFLETHEESRVKGGVILFRGTGAAACRYLESDRSRADDYYLKDGTTIASFTVTDGTGEVRATAQLDPEGKSVV